MSIYPWRGVLGFIAGLGVYFTFVIPSQLGNSEGFNVWYDIAFPGLVASTWSYCLYHIPKEKWKFKNCCQEKVMSVRDPHLRIDEKSPLINNDPGSHLQLSISIVKSEQLEQSVSTALPKFSPEQTAVLEQKKPVFPIVYSSMGDYSLSNLIPVSIQEAPSQKTPNNNLD